MEILDRIPIVLTKDRSWGSEYLKSPLRDGQIITLPEDAILILLPKEEKELP